MRTRGDHRDAAVVLAVAVGGPPLVAAACAGHLAWRRAFLHDQFSGADGRGADRAHAAVEQRPRIVRCDVRAGCRAVAQFGRVQPVGFADEIAHGLVIKFRPLHGSSPFMSSLRKSNGTSPLGATGRPARAARTCPGPSVPGCRAASRSLWPPRGVYRPRESTDGLRPAVIRSFQVIDGRSREVWRGLERSGGLPFRQRTGRTAGAALIAMASLREDVVHDEPTKGPWRVDGQARCAPSCRAGSARSAAGRSFLGSRRAHRARLPRSRIRICGQEPSPTRWLGGSALFTGRPAG